MAERGATEGPGPRAADMDTEQRISKRMEELREIFFPEYFKILHIPHFIASGCNVPYLETYAAGAAPLKGRRDDENIDGIGDGRQRWIPGGQNGSLVEEFVKFCVSLINPEDFKPYGVGQLPSIDEVNPGQLERTREIDCRVIRCKSPSDFHIVFRKRVKWFPLNAYNEQWLEFFRQQLGIPLGEPRVHDDNAQEKVNQLKSCCFRSPFDLYDGVSSVLTQLVEYVRTPGNLTDAERARLENQKYFPGDLVVVSVKDIGGSRAYRAAILEPAIVMVDLDSEPDSDCFLVYLLETGERRVVTKKTLLPLPKPFVYFRPLAVRCTLSRLLPNDQVEGWTETAVSTIREIFNCNQGRFIAKSFVRLPYVPSEDLGDSNTLLLLDKLAYSVHFSVDLIDKYRRWNNVAKFFMRLGLGIMEPEDALTIIEESESDEETE